MFYSWEAHESVSLDDLIEVSRELDARKTDYTVPMRELAIDDEAHLVVPEGGDWVAQLFSQDASGPQALRLRDHALAQLCERLGPPPTRYMRECPPGLRADNLRYWLHKRQERDKSSWLVRGWTPDGGRDEARAVLTEQYTPVSNTSVIEAVRDTLDGAPYELIRPYVDGDQVHVRVRVAGSDDGNYGIGAYVRNGETGNYTIMVSPFVQRTSCTNSILFTRNAWSQRHAHVSQAFVRGALREKLGWALERSAELMERIVEAELDAIPKFASVLERVCKRHGLSADVQHYVSAGSEGSSTRMGLVNGVSYAAHATPLISQGQRVQLEELAGALLESPGSVLQALAR